MLWYNWHPVYQISSFVPVCYTFPSTFYEPCKDLDSPKRNFNFARRFWLIFFGHIQSFLTFGSPYSFHFSGQVELHLMNIHSTTDLCLSTSTSLVLLWMIVLDSKIFCGSSGARSNQTSGTTTAPQKKNKQAGQVLVASKKQAGRAE